MLSQINLDPRDTNITFKEENHEYTIVGMNRKPISVTTLIHNYFDEFDADAVIRKMMSSANWAKSKYYGRTPESIKEEWENTKNEASHNGTLMHKSIEQYINNEDVDNPSTKEFGLFMKFWTEFFAQYSMLAPYRTEWLVYDEDVGVAGSIDCVLSDKNGNLVLLDWKRSKEIKLSNRFAKGKHPFSQYDDCNFTHYSLQLNFYRHILETKYHKNVIFMMLVILHPNQSSYICHPVNKIDVDHVWNSLIITPS